MIMWKKLLITFIAFIGVCSVGYAYYNEKMNAAGTIYNAGGNVIGRVNMAPNGVSGANIGLQKGDKIYTGINNPSDNTDLGMMLIALDENYIYYNVTLPNTISSGPPLTGWFSMATSSIANVSPISSNGLYTNTTPDGYIYVKYADSDLPAVLSGVNAAADKSNLFLPQDFTDWKYYQNYSFSAKEMILNNALECNEKMFLYHHVRNYLDNHSVPATYSSSVSFADLSFREKYYNSANDHTPRNGRYYNWWGFNTDGMPIDIVNCMSQNVAVRPSAFINTSIIVFGLSSGTGNGLASVKENTLSSGYTLLWDEISSDPHMKVRIENNALSSTTQLNQIEYKNTSITKVNKNATVYLNANAQAGSDGNGGIYTVSALVFNDKNEFVYYKPLESAKGSGTYEFDLTGIPAGTYQIGIVNEA